MIDTYFEKFNSEFCKLNLAPITLINNDISIIEEIINIDYQPILGVATSPNNCKILAPSTKFPP